MSDTKAPDSPEAMTFKDMAAWEAWLSKNYGRQEGVWMKVARKGSGIESVAIHDALDVALCYGWIDGIRKSFDENYYLQKYTPRRPRSLWSQVNIGKVESLIAGGRMKEPGLAEIAKAKADGRWHAAYASQKNATIPPDLAEGLAKNKQAKDFFDSLDGTNRYAFLWRLMTARTPETRAKRLAAILAMLDEGKTYH